MSKKKRGIESVGVDSTDGTLDVSSRSGMESWVARQELINRVRFFFFFRFDVFNDPYQTVLRSVAKFNFALTCEYDENSTDRKKFR